MARVLTGPLMARCREDQVAQTRWAGDMGRDRRRLYVVCAWLRLPTHPVVRGCEREARSFSGNALAAGSEGRVFKELPHVWFLGPPDAHPHPHWDWGLNKGNVPKASAH